MRVSSAANRGATDESRTMLQRNALVPTILFVSLSAFLCLAILYTHDNSYTPPAWSIELNRSAPVAVAAVNQSESWLSDHNLSYPIRYSCRQILTQVYPGLHRPSLTKLDFPLFDQYQIVKSIQSYDEGSLPCLEPVHLDVPAFTHGSANASNLMFGIQTTVKRLDDSIPQFVRWLSNTSAKLVVLLKESENVAADENQMARLESRMRRLGLDVTLLHAKEGDTFPQRYFSLVDILYNKRVPETQWISLIDDDTFFPSMPSLLAMLAQHNSKDQHYIGSLSEDWWAVSHYGFMGFGGAGLFLSVPLAEALSPYADECRNSLRSSAGDITVMDCIYTHTSTKLTHIPDLHQADMHGDLSGFYESGRPHLSLHHWKEGSVSGKGYRIDSMHQVADVCGECFLQRWQFGDEMVLVNGFSIAVYPQGHLKANHEHAIDVERMEETWNSNMNVRHSLGPARERLKLDEEKIQYTFLDSIPADGGVRQLYLHKGVGDDMDTVLELFWKDQDS